MGVLGKIVLLLLISLGFSSKLAAQGQENDFEFFKKYGHASKVWNDYVQKGFEAYDRQDCNGTLSTLKEAIAAQCQDALVFFKVAVCSEVAGSPYTALQYYQLAEEKLNKLQTIHRYHKDIYEAYGRALFQSKKYDQAFPYLTRATALGTPSFGLFYMVGHLHLMKNDPRGAIEHFEKALGQDITGVTPQTLGPMYREVAKAYYAMKDYPRTLQLVGKALELIPQDPEALRIKNEISVLQQQQSIVKMIEGLTNEGQGMNKPQPVIGAPPPAAAKLPPLDGGPAMKDPTPPLGTTVPPGQPTTPSTTSPPPPTAPSYPTATTPSPPSSGPPNLEPLPPAGY